MIEYTVVSGVVFAFLTFIWSSKSWPDKLIKFGLLLLTVWSIFLSLQTFGYVVKL